MNWWTHKTKKKRVQYSTVDKPNRSVEMKTLQFYILSSTRVEGEEKKEIFCFVSFGYHSYVFIRKALKPFMSHILCN